MIKISKRILILGGGAEQMPAIERAKNKGIKTLVFDMDESVPASAYADEFYPISTRDVSAIKKFLEGYNNKIDGIMTIGSDIPHCVSEIGEYLGLEVIPLTAAKKTVDKFLMKEEFSKMGVPIPAYSKVLTLNDLQSFIGEHGYPIVLKPLDNSGARGVLRITEGMDLQEAMETSLKYARTPVLMAEKFLDGPQVSIEGLLFKDKLYITGFFDRCYDRVSEFAPYIIEDGGEAPSKLSETDRAKINEAFEKSASALGITWGPVKGDMVLSDGNAYVIEIAARLSGGYFCSDHVPLSTGVDIVDIYIDMCVGNPVDTELLKDKFSRGVAQRFFFPKHGKLKAIRGIDSVKSMPEIKRFEIYVKEGDILPDIVSHPSRSGNVIAVAKDRETAVEIAEKAISMVEFEIEEY